MQGVFRLCFLLTVFCWLFGIRVLAADGALDFSFGVQGRQATFIPNGQGAQYSIPNGVVVQPDGKIVVAGSSLTVGTKPLITILRYNTDGSLDSSFGSGGITRTAIGNGTDTANSVVLQPDGKIVIAGSTYIGIAPSGDANTGFALARYNPNGSLDTSFGNGGVVVTDFFPTLDQAFEVLLQTDGRIVAAGFVTPGASNDGLYDFAVVRYNANGSIDTSFGAGGHTFTDFTAGHDVAYSAVLQADGKIVLAGVTSLPNTPNLHFALARYNPDGSLDTSFDDDGRVTTTFPGSSTELARSVKLARDGKLIVVGNANFGAVTESKNDFALARYNTDGSLDLSFDGDGRRVYGVTGGGSENSEYGYDLVVQSDNKIIVVGGSRLFTRPQGADVDFEIFRLNPNGSIDSSFGTSGNETYTDFGEIFYPPDPPIYGTGHSGEPVFGMAATLQPDGKLIVTGGTAFSRNRHDFGVARYLTGLSSSAQRTFADFDGDGKSDIGVYRSGTWYLSESAAGETSFQFGLATDKIVPADYDGDGRTDAAVYRDGTWYLMQSRDGVRTVQFGLADDTPQPGDYDGDGRDDVAVWRASDGVWYVLRSRDGFSAYKFGQTGDRPIAADFDGDGRADYAVYRAGTWYLQRSTEGFTAYQFGFTADKTIVADYDGDGRADSAVFREGVWYVLKSTGGYSSVQYGDNGDIPTPADYNGDGKADYAVFRNGTWWMQMSPTSGDTVYNFGLASDVPIQSVRVR
ncbi:MAG TPA: FG-GAP-like repeat-containing protein [Pyrinomonadaceae bacterium]|jgi:uncharacterized delta-60 repeat protein